MKKTNLNKPSPELARAAATILRRAKKLFGPNGEHWIQDNTFEKGSYCSVGATRQAALCDPDAEEAFDHGYVSYKDTGDGDYEGYEGKIIIRPDLDLAEKALEEAYGDEIISFNDDGGTNFAKVKAGFNKAIRSLESQYKKKGS